MGKGNVNKAQQKRERNAKKQPQKKGETSQLANNQKSMTFVCTFCKQAFMNTSTEQILKDHAEKHSKAGKTFADCFPTFVST
jgi:hypothetical protein